MDLDWSPEARAFREELRTWLADNIPPEHRPHDPLAGAEFDRAWQRQLFDAGWAGLNWPEAHGGRGLSIVQQIIWYEEYVRASGPPMGFRFVAQNHAGPTLIALGTEAQKARHLLPILTGESLWCQGFSEPNAGSDLASLRSRGVVDGDELIVSGQKIWTTGADQTDFQELLVRTDPGSLRHKGLTWVICPMDAAGIDIRPIRKMTGRAEFCAVFYDEVRIPLGNVVGEVNSGWATAMATLGFERGTSFIGEMAEIQLRLETLIEEAKVSGAWRDDEVRRRLADRRAEVAALRALNYANLSRYAKGGAPGAEGSITKLLTNEVGRSVNELEMELAGGEALEGDLATNGAADRLLNGIVLSIGGGTPEIQREIIADRVLELPEEPLTMDLTLQEDEAQIAAMAEELLSQELVLERWFAPAVVPAAEEDRLRALAAELGWIGFGAPEAIGGSGVSAVEEAVLFREIGRFLAPVSLAAGAAAARIAAAADPALAGRIIAGEAVVGVVAPRNAERVWRLGAHGGDLGVRLEGGRLELVAVGGLKGEACLDPTVTGQSAAAGEVRVLSEAADTTEALRYILSIAAQQLGLAEAALARIVAYAKLREQFGRLIGSFQAVRHRCVDMAVRCERARAQLWFAAVSLRQNASDCHFQAAAAMRVCDDAAQRNARDNIFLHGAIGVTAENEGHLFLKRALLWRQVVPQAVVLEEIAHGTGPDL